MSSIAISYEESLDLLCQLSRSYNNPNNVTLLEFLVLSFLTNSSLMENGDDQDVYNSILRDNYLVGFEHTEAGQMVYNSIIRTTLGFFPKFKSYNTFLQFTRNDVYFVNDYTVMVNIPNNQLSLYI